MALEILSLNRTQKILLTLFDLSKKKKKDIRYEDIVVNLFKKYPNEFHLKGYPQYPDSGDGPQRILYEEKTKGRVTSGNKYFKLTEKGVEYVKELQKRSKGKTIKEMNRLSAYAEKELKRISRLNGFTLFVKGEYEKIFDTDFYNYLGLTVRTDKSDFKGRIKTLRDVMGELKKIKSKEDKFFNKVIEFHVFLFDKFKNDIEYKLLN